MIIRKAILKDAEQIAKLYLQFWEVHKDKNPLHQPHWKINYKNCLIDTLDAIQDKEYEMYVAYESGIVMGFILIVIKEHPEFYNVKRYGYIEEVVVDKNYRRNGIAKKMVRFVLKHYKKKGLKYVQIAAEIKLPIAIKAWESLGFKQETIELVRKL